MTKSHAFISRMISSTDTKQIGHVCAVCTFFSNIVPRPVFFNERMNKYGIRVSRDTVPFVTR